MQSPEEVKVREVPIGEGTEDGEVIMERVAVPQREERASPLNPRVETSARSEKEVSFEVWCFNAVPFLLVSFGGGRAEGGGRTDPCPV
jgi:hypothetical protein